MKELGVPSELRISYCTEKEPDLDVSTIASVHRNVTWSHELVHCVLPMQVSTSWSSHFRVYNQTSDQQRGIDNGHHRITFSPPGRSHNSLHFGHSISQHTPQTTSRCPPSETSFYLLPICETADKNSEQ